jgi:hypothetical protein
MKVIMLDKLFEVLYCTASAGRNDGCPKEERSVGFEKINVFLPPPYEKFARYGVIHGINSWHEFK